MTEPQPSGSLIGSVVAVLAAFGLGCLAAVMMVAGHHPWDGPEVAGLVGTHGLHQGDLYAVAPLIAGTWLAAWCWRHHR